jgi:ribosomal protein S12 methylthiotransferase accessory factor YcaO
LAGRSREVTAFDLHTVFGARIRAAEVAILAYVAGSGLPAGAGTAQPLAPVRPEELLTWSGLPYGDAGPDWMPARSLGDGTRREVPAGAVYPDERELLFEPTGAGAGCGRTEAEAVRAGLLSAFAYQGLRAAVRGERPAHLLAADELAGDTDAEFLLRAAKHLDLPVTLLRLPGAGPAHAVIALTLGQNRPLWSVGAGLDRGTAVRRALADLLGLWQLVGDDAASEQLDLGEPLMADVDPRAIPVEAVGAPAPAGPATVEDLLGSLAAGDRAAYAVDTTPRDLREAGYVTVRVLLSR